MSNKRNPFVKPTNGLNGKVGGTPQLLAPKGFKKGKGFPPWLGKNGILKTLPKIPEKVQPTNKFRPPGINKSKPKRKVWFPPKISLTPQTFQI